MPFKPRFLGFLDLRNLEEKDFRFSLLSSLAYEAAAGRWIVTPVNFWTDLGSIPWFTPFITRAGAAAKPYVTHDWLYHLIRQGTPHELAPTRADADRVLREALVATGRWRIKAWAVWLAVRVGGWPTLVSAKKFRYYTVDAAPTVAGV